MFQGIFRTTVKFGDLLRCKCNVEFFAEVLEDFALFFKRKFFNLLQNLRCTHSANLPLPNLHASDKWVLVLVSLRSPHSALQVRMIPREILKKIRQIELRTNRIVNV